MAQGSVYEFPRANNTCACAGTCAGMPDDGPGEVPLEGSLRLETQLRLMTQRSLFFTLDALTSFSPLPKVNQKLHFEAQFGRAEGTLPQ